VTSPLTARMKAAMKARQPLCLIAEIDHPDGFVRVWSGIGSMIWNGETYAGLGRLGKVQALGTTTDLALRDFSLELSGVDADLLTGLGSDVRNRPATVWFGALDAYGRVVADPLQVAAGVMDYQTLTTDLASGTSTIAITVIDGLWILNSALDASWSTEEQINRYPGDTGLDLIPQLYQKSVTWSAS
jgi:hypothetical protein